MQRMRTIAPMLAVLLSGIVYARPVPQRTLDDFFKDFTTHWMRANPNQAASTRHFTGAEQERLGRQNAPAPPQPRPGANPDPPPGLVRTGKIGRAPTTD